MIKTNNDNYKEKYKKEMNNYTTKQKLDFVFVVLGIITFSLTAYLHIKTIKKLHLAEQEKQNNQNKV